MSATLQALKDELAGLEAEAEALPLGAGTEEAAYAALTVRDEIDGQIEYVRDQITAEQAKIR